MVLYDAAPYSAKKSFERFTTATEVDCEGLRQDDDATFRPFHSVDDDETVHA